MADPVKVRRFVSVIGVLAKTDKVDAQVIVQFGATIKPGRKPIPDEHSRQIKDLLIRRKQLLVMSTMEKNWLQVMPKALHGSINAILTASKKQVDRITEQLDQLVFMEQCWRMPVNILTSVPGIGNILAYTLLSEFPELGQLNRKQIVELIGLTPMN